MNAAVASSNAASSNAASNAPLLPPLHVRVRTAARAIGILVRDPNRLDQVLVMAQAVNAKMVERAVLRLEAEAEGRALLAAQPRIDRAHTDFDALRKLPDGTLGREYVRFLDDNGIGPEPFEALPDHIDPRAAYVMLRMRQTHDLWHVLTGYAPDVRGEILLQAFTYAQVHAPSAFLLYFGGALRQRMFLRRRDRAALDEALARGQATKLLVTFRWEDHWATPVSELRAMLGCPPSSVA